ncbi:MAG: alpha-1,4-glucan--maltose-1-phosphate maltosyltransferase [Pirellulales bacterium]
MEDTTLGRQRVVIENIRPRSDSGRFAIKRVVGDAVAIEADAFADGHDHIVVLLLHRKKGGVEWIETPMESIFNDRYRASFAVEELGRYQFTVEAWIDRFHTWRYDLTKRAAAGQDVAIDLLIGAELIEATANRAIGGDQRQILQAVQRLRGGTDQKQRVEIALDQELLALVDRYADRKLATTHKPALEIIVDRLRARFSTWYELFPRSWSTTPGKHGSFRDCIDHLPEIAQMGFDILYLPPVHPIGTAFRKGKNNAVSAAPDDVGSPWAIGGREGGHKSIHPELGSLEDFRALCNAAKSQGMEVALDIAFQCSPDHPYVKEHPEWFRKRPDGTIQYAENPPKKYQDIYPFDFECDNWQALWHELRSVFQFWIDQGVNCFRVDNPHTKPFGFWEWAITSLKEKHPDLIFLSEAFTRPKIMCRLAKLGFTQSYTYFTWRNTKQELIEYFTELTQTDVREVFRPNLWPNTPDILHEFLQTGGRPAFIARLVLAATLGANYGMYAPAFELCENVPREPKSEEYLNSEKYEVRTWELEQPDSLRPLIAQVNRIRREHVALQSDWSLRFHTIGNEHLLAYSKRDERSGDFVLTIVNLNPHAAQSGWLELELAEIGLSTDQAYRVVDLLAGMEFVWQGPRAFISLDPSVTPAHIFHIPR